MQTSPRLSAPSDTRQKLLDAAARVFARHGLAGATTRAIAEEAGVNEVTLFRHFQTKDRLLAAVVGENFGDAGNEPADATLPPATADLRADLVAHARHYEKLLKHNISLVRTMIGEIHHRHRGHEKQVFSGIFGPVKAAILERIRLAQEAGELSADLQADILADLFGAMIFTGTLRRTAPHLHLNYSAATYLEAAVDLILNGARPPRRSHG
jgi:AcrR family transcriptional regulator